MLGSNPSGPTTSNSLAIQRLGLSAAFEILLTEGLARKVDEVEFKRFLEKSFGEKAVQNSIEIVRETENFLRSTGATKSLSQASIEDLHSIVAYFFQNEKNTWENMLALLRFSRFAGNREVEIALLELLDGSDVLDNISSILKQTLGEKRRKKIFEGITIPLLGTFSVDKPKTTKKLIERMEAEIGEHRCREVLLSGPHASPKEEYLPERKAFLKSEGVDDFLRKRHKEYVDELEQHKRLGTLYFTQEIDDEVLDYVRNTPTCQNGVREGNIIYVTKIPYMAKRYLNEKDSKMKRYYYCHCPWTREAIKSGIDISPNFCYCSAGFEKRPWDVIFNQSVKADVVETVLKGDLVCRFAIHIPQTYSETSNIVSKRRSKS